MKDTNGAQAATDEQPGAPKVAPRFTRAVNAERSRLEGKRAQLLLKREAAQAELGRIDRAVQATDELLELLAPLLAANGNEPERQVRTARRGGRSRRISSELAEAREPARAQR